jgi:hypothetical protein
MARDICPCATTRLRRSVRRLSWRGADPKDPTRAEAPAHPLSRRAARLLRGRGPRDQDRGDGAREMGRAGLCAPRDRAQQVCRGRAARQGRGLRRRARRLPGRPAGDLLRPWRAEGRPGRGRAARDDLCRRHLPAGVQGPYRGRAPPRERAADGDDRPCGPPRDRGHHGPVARGRGDPRGDGRGRGGHRTARSRRSPSSPRPRCRWTTPPGSSRRCARASRHRRAAQGRHLLRHHQPAGGREGHGAQGGRDAGDRGAQFVELDAAGGGRAARGLRLCPACPARDGHRLARAGRHPFGRHHGRAPRRPKSW